MPTYDYSCTLCGDTFEERQKITDAPLTHCHKCHKEGLKRGIGGGLATFRFVGEGFYQTDYKKEKKECANADSSGCCPCKEK
jgi:putative FmdB family regulatory protein